MIVLFYLFYTCLTPCYRGLDCRPDDTPWDGGRAMSTQFWKGKYVQHQADFPSISF